jgi:hypothetical protein
MRFASLLLMGCLAACAGSGEANGDPDRAASPAQGETPSLALAAEPDVARRPPEDLLTEGGVYYGCRTDADCAVKNVGNCCGYYPACVNAGSPTFPDKVKADCAAEGRMGVCGFPQIRGCECLEGRCRNLSGAAPGEVQ